MIWRYKKILNDTRKKSFFLYMNAIKLCFSMVLISFTSNMFDITYVKKHTISVCLDFKYQGEIICLNTWWKPVMILIFLSCKIFEHFALQVGSINWVHKTQIHSIKKWHHFGEAAPSPLNTGSSILDLDRLMFCTIQRCQLDEIQDLETSGLYYKTFRIVIYDRNDSTIVEPVL